MLVADLHDEHPGRRPYQLFQGFGLLSLELSFGVAFWLAFAMHTLAAETYLARRPSARGAARSALAVADH